MADSYLQLAEEVLKARGKPLSAQSILSEAKRFGLMPKHLTGPTKHKTLQARISDNINSLQKDSRFYRVGVGKYFLRELATDPTLPVKLKKEQDPPGRVKSIEEARLLHSSNTSNEDRPIIASLTDALSRIEQDNCFKYARHRLSTETLIGTFTIIRWGNSIFLHDIGKFSFFFSEDLAKFSTIGLRRYVDEFDDDIFKVVDFGIDFSAAREVIRNIAITDEPDFIDDREIRKNMKVLGAALEPDKNSLFFVIEVNLEQTGSHNIIFRKRKDIRNQRWVQFELIEGARLDPLSKLLISAGLVR